MLSRTRHLSVTEFYLRFEGKTIWADGEIEQALRNCQRRFGRRFPILAGPTIKLSRVLSPYKCVMICAPTAPQRRATRRLFIGRISFDTDRVAHLGRLFVFHLYKLHNFPMSRSRRNLAFYGRLIKTHHYDPRVVLYIYIFLSSSLLFNGTRRPLVSVAVSSTV